MEEHKSDLEKLEDNGIYFQELGSTVPNMKVL